MQRRATDRGHRLAQGIGGLAGAYWRSGERWSAAFFSIVIVIVSLAMVGINLMQNIATGSVFTALQENNARGFYLGLGGLMAAIVSYMFAAVAQLYLRQTFQLRWRRWLTDHYLKDWLARHVFYRMRFRDGIDNPDQRISEDVRGFIEQTMTLSLGLLGSVAGLATFAALLWQLSGTLTVQLAGVAVAIPGYMVWAAILYAGLGSVFAHLIGRPLIRLNNLQQGKEADFRFNLVRLREEAEGITLYGAEEQERKHALDRFRALYENMRLLIRSNVRYVLYQLLVSQAAYGLSLLLASPRYFSGAILLGTLVQISNAFERVNESLSWLIGSYPTVAEWRATADRLVEFAGTISPHVGPATGPNIHAGDHSVELREVKVSLPDGSDLIAPATLKLKPHEAVMFRGPSGSGKSTLFRVLAGLWPYASGEILLPAQTKTLFLPQRPYMPIGTLREAIWFPERPRLDRDDEAIKTLGLVGLGHMTRRLDENAHWAQTLSPGEQQRIAIARALLLKPDWLFLDDVTAVHDEREEAELYRCLTEGLPHTTIISIGQRHSLEAFHDRMVALDASLGRPTRIVPMS
jgi:vitamin B12/bleomycin/antimicrobial peptide transport system ATP-binding/permease protein